MAAMFGWVSEARRWASRRKRARRSASSANSAGRNLRATSRPSRESWACHTSPMPPAPRAATISYDPSRAPGLKDDVMADDSILALSFAVAENGTARGVQNAIRCAPMKAFIALLSLATLPLIAPTDWRTAPAADWQAIFNGRNLDGWTVKLAHH